MERKNNIDLATAARIARIVRTHEELVEIVKKKHKLSYGEGCRELGEEITRFVCYLLGEIFWYEYWDKFPNKMYTDWKDIPESILETAKKSGRGTSFFAREIEQTSKLRYYRELYINKYKIDEPFLEATEEIAKTNTYIKLFLEPGGTPYNGSHMEVV